MGEATLIIAIVIAVVIVIVVIIAVIIAASISPISLSFSLSLFWWLVVLIVGGWLILVDGGRLISCGCEIWDVYEILVYGVFFFFFFFV